MPKSHKIYKEHGWQLELELPARVGVCPKDDTGIDYEVVLPQPRAVPAKCIICHRPFLKPVVTKCSYNFCEGCVMNHFRSSPRCYVCQKQTQGIFSPAQGIINKFYASTSFMSQETQTRTPFSRLKLPALLPKNYEMFGGCFGKTNKNK